MRLAKTETVEEIIVRKVRTSYNTHITKMSTIKIKAEKRVCYRRSRTKLFQIVAILEAVTPLPLFDDGCDTHNTGVTDMMASHRTEALSRLPGQSKHDINNNMLLLRRRCLGEPYNEMKAVSHDKILVHARIVCIHISRH